MDFVLCGGDLGGTTASFPTGTAGETISLDVGMRLAVYEIRTYEIDGLSETQAVFIGYIAKS